MMALWLWQHPDLTLHALSPTGHRHLGRLSPPASPPAHAQTAAHGADAADGLPAPLWDWLKDYEGQAVELALDASLSDDWQVLAWETLSWRGQKLGDWLRVVRHAQPDPVDRPPTEQGGSLVWDQWPDRQFERLWDSFCVSRRSKRSQIDRELGRGQNLGHYARLIIIAHGAKDGQGGLVDKDGNHWPPELPATLPPEVLVLACGSYHGNWHELAVACLDRGARAVVCGHGPLNAALMADFLANWLQDHQLAGEPLATSRRLWALQNQPGDELGGVRWLRYYGAVTCGDYDRLTLAFFKAPSRPNPVCALSKTVNDTPQAKELVRKVQHSTACWPLTQSWLLPLALYWAEKHHHAAMAGLDKRRRDLQATVACAELAAERAYGMAAMYRRDGRYGLALAQLAEGLRADAGPSQQVQLLGSLLNHLIDLNLPEAGQQVADRLHTRLANVDDPEQQFRLLDRTARLALRQGQPEIARQHWQRKQQQAVELAANDHRELAALLYLAAWQASPQGHALADQLTTRLGLNAPIHFDGGNDDPAYGLRALAAWQWRRHPEDGRFAAWLPIWLPIFQERLSQPDPGPFAYALWFHSLATGDPGVRPSAAAALERGRYWLELAAFHALAADQQQAGRALEQFHTLRRDALRPLAEAKLYGIDWQAEAESRQQRERRVLLGGPTSADELIQNGLLPL